MSEFGIHSGRFQYLSNQLHLQIIGAEFLILRTLETEGSFVLIDPVSLPYIEGATLDFQTSIVKTAFEIIDNPNAEQGCGCGVSFSPKEDV